MTDVCQCATSRSVTSMHRVSENKLHKEMWLQTDKGSSLGQSVLCTVQVTAVLQLAQRHGVQQVTNTQQKRTGAQSVCRTVSQTTNIRKTEEARLNLQMALRSFIKSSSGGRFNLRSSQLIGFVFSGDVASSCWGVFRLCLVPVTAGLNLHRALFSLQRAVQQPANRRNVPSGCFLYFTDFSLLRRRQTVIQNVAYVVVHVHRM
jgi:hypothetical protein